MDVATAPRPDRSFSCHCSRSHRLLNVSDRVSIFRITESDRKALPRKIARAHDMKHMLPIASFDEDRQVRIGCIRRHGCGSSDRILALGSQAFFGHAELRSRSFQPQPYAPVNAGQFSGFLQGTEPDHRERGDPPANHQQHNDRHSALLCRGGDSLSKATLKNPSFVLNPTVLNPTPSFPDCVETRGECLP